MSKLTAQERSNHWTKRYSESKETQQQLRDAYARWYDSFFAVYRDRVAPWRSKVLDPKVAAKAKAVIAKVALANPEPNFIPNDIHDFIKARNNEVLVKNDLKNPLFDQPIFFKKNSVLTDAVVCGTGLAMVPWTYTEQSYYTRMKEKDGKVSLTEEKVKKVKVGFNDFIPVSIFRVFLEPGAQSFYGSRYVIIEDFKDLEDVEEMAERRGGFKNMKDVTVSGTGDLETRKFERSRNRLLGIQSTEENKVHLWHCWDRVTKEYCIYANDGAVEIYTDKNYYWHGKYPMVPFYTVPRAHSPWGMGLFEATERLEAANNALINHFFDQLDLSLNGFMLRSEGTSILYQDMQPGGEVVYAGEKPEFAEVQQPDAQGFQIARQLLSEAIEENTISQYELGIPRSQTDKTRGTASGIQSIQEAAGDMVRFFETSYAESCKQWFGMWMSNNQQFMDRERAVRILGPHGYFPKIVKPEDIVTASQLDVEVDTDAMRPRSKDMDRALKVEWMEKQLELYTLSRQAAAESMAQGDPSVMPLKINFYEMSRVFSDAMGIKEFDRIIEPSSTANDSPQTENDLMLQGKEMEPTPDEDHEVHIQVHTELLSDSGVDSEIQMNVQAHIAVHEMYLQQMQEQEQMMQLEELKATEAQTAQMAGMLTPETISTQNAQLQPQAQAVGSQSPAQVQTRVPEPMGGPSILR